MNSYKCTDEFEKVVRALSALTDRVLMGYDTAPEGTTEEELEAIWNEYRAISHIYKTALIMLHKICEAEAGGTERNYKNELAKLLNFTSRKRQQAEGGYKEGYTKALHMLSGAYLLEIKK